MAELYFGQGIPLSASFDLGSPKPLDARTVVSTLEELEAMPEVRKYVGLTTYVVEEEKKYLWTGTEWVAEISTGIDGEDGKDGEQGVGLYAATVAVDAEAHTVAIENVVPTGIRVGDNLLDSNGDVFTVTAVDETTVTVGDSAIVNIKGADGADGAKGEKGDPFTVAKTFASIQEMNDGFETDGIAEGSFVVISSDVEDEDNAKLYIKGATEYTFITDLSGATGIKGDAGTIEIGIVTTNNPNTKASVTNVGTSTAAVLDIVIPRGADGTDGVDGDNVKIGETYATAEDATLFFRTVSTVTDTSDEASAIGLAKIGEAPIA